MRTMALCATIAIAICACLMQLNWIDYYCNMWNVLKCHSPHTDYFWFLELENAVDKAHVQLCARVQMSYFYINCTNEIKIQFKFCAFALYQNAKRRDQLKGESTDSSKLLHHTKLHAYAWKKQIDEAQNCANEIMSCVWMIMFNATTEVKNNSNKRIKIMVMITMDQKTQQPAW